MNSHLSLVHNAKPMTFGEGFLAGHEEGYTQGRRDRGLELALIGYFAGLITLALFLLIFK